MIDDTLLPMDAPNGPLRVVISARKSADDGPDESKSVQDQVNDLRAQAEQRGWTVVATYKDDGVSGWVWDEAKRPGIFRTMEHVERREADVVMCWWANRLSRDDVRRELITRDCEAHDVRIWVGSSRSFIDRSTAAGFVNDKIDQVLGAWQSRLISDNWKDAHRRRRDKGLVSGKARYGYAIPAHDDGTPVRDAPQAPAEPAATELRNLYRRFTDGAGMQTLAKDLNARGVPAPGGGAWAPVTVARTLDSGFGAGLISRGGRKTKDGVFVPLTYIQGAQEPVIDAAEWQRYLDAREARRGVAPKARNSPWNLRGLVKCGLCGASVSLAGANVVCSRSAAGRQCAGVVMRRHLVDRAVNRWTLVHLDELANTLPDRTEARAEAQRALEDAQGRADAVDAALGRLASGWARGQVDDAGYAAAKAELTADKDSLAAELREARDELDRLGGAPGDPLDALAERFESAPDMSPAEYGKRLGRILRRVELWPDRLVIVPVVGRATEEERMARERGGCSVEGCGEPHHSKSFCSKHYQSEHRREYMKRYRAEKKAAEAVESSR